MIDDLRRLHPGLFDNIQFETGPLKTVDRATAKIIGDYDGDHSQIRDLARGRLVVDTPEQVDAIRNYLAQNRAALGIEEMKDRFANPSGTNFRDINMSMRLPNGHVVELRIEQRGLLEAARLTHEPYERVQEIERQAKLEGRNLTDAERIERQRLLDQVRDIHDSAARPAGLNTLLNDQGRARLATHEAERVTPRAPVATMADADNATIRAAERTAEIAAETGRLGRIFQAAGTVVGTVGKVLPVVGGAVAVIEGLGMNNAAEAAQAGGRLTEAQLAEYRAGIGAYIGEEIYDPTNVIGGLTLDQWWDNFRQRAPNLTADDVAAMRPPTLTNMLEVSGPNMTPAQRLFSNYYDAMPQTSDLDGAPESMVRMARMRDAIVEAEAAEMNARNQMPVDQSLLASARLRLDGNGEQLGVYGQYEQAWASLSLEEVQSHVTYMQDRAAQRLADAGLEGDVTLRGQTMSITDALKNPQAFQALRDHMRAAGNDTAIRAMDEFRETRQMADAWRGFDGAYRAATAPPAQEQQQPALVTQRDVPAFDSWEAGVMRR